MAFDWTELGKRYDAGDLKALEAHESLLELDSFCEEDARRLGGIITELDREYEQPVAIRIVSETDGTELFRHIMEGKSEKNAQYAELKRQAVLRFGHSSAWAAVEHLVSGKPFSMNEGYILSGGAFPIRVGGRLAATVAVSGLHEGKDHELVVRALSRLAGVPEPAAFPKPLF